MAAFVINEWLWHHAAGEDTGRAQREAYEVVTRFSKSVHQAVVVEGSPFEKKMWRLCKIKDTRVVGIAIAFIHNVRQNSDRCLLLRPEEVADLGEPLASSVNPDDHYLVQAQFAIDGAILVTTDAALREKVLEANLPCLSREEFLGQFFPM